ncbi:MAG TPA: hypothetical protein PKO24_04920 [Methanomassiliicoccales archaeon]|nr:hypothetical protein [Methanomassiliicoccales archaeon]
MRKEVGPEVDRAERELGPDMLGMRVDADRGHLLAFRYKVPARPPSSSSATGRG